MKILSTTLIVAALTLETLSTPTNADQNVFTNVYSTETVVPPADELPSHNSSAPGSQFKIITGSSPGKGRGGDRLKELKSSSSLSFFPRSVALSTPLIETMDKHFGVCVSDAAKKAGLGTVKNINVSHMGGYRDRRINNGSKNPNRPWSLHASGRALDIGRIDVTASNGKTYGIPMTKASHDGKNGKYEKTFYQSFVACWKEKVTNKCGSRTVLDCKYNKLHHDHVHIALPFCPRKPGIAST